MSGVSRHGAKFLHFEYVALSVRYFSLHTKHLIILFLYIAVHCNAFFSSQNCAKIFLLFVHCYQIQMFNHYIFSFLQVRINELSSHDADEDINNKS